MLCDEHVWQKMVDLSFMTTCCAKFFFVSMTHCRVTIVVFYIWLLTPFSVHDSMSCAGHILPRQAATPRLQQGPGSKRGGRGH